MAHVIATAHKSGLLIKGESTYVIKDSLKNCRGTWNPWLRGWIFPGRRSQDIIDTLRNSKVLVQDERPLAWVMGPKDLFGNRVTLTESRAMKIRSDGQEGSAARSSNTAVLSPAELSEARLCTTPGVKASIPTQASTPPRLPHTSPALHASSSKLAKQKCGTEIMLTPPKRGWNTSFATTPSTSSVRPKKQNSVPTAPSECRLSDKTRARFAAILSKGSANDPKQVSSDNTQKQQKQRPKPAIDPAASPPLKQRRIV